MRPAFTNPVVPENNYSMLMSLNKSVYIIKAAQSSSKAEKLSLNEFGGMQPVFQLSVGARVILFLNLRTKVDLWNGAMEEVKSLIYKKNIIPPSLPIAVLVKFDNYNGPTFYNVDLIPICPVSLVSCAAES